jgi:uncharacterized protein (DUF362 family)
MKKKENGMNRRQMLKMLGFGTMASLFPGVAFSRTVDSKKELTDQTIQGVFHKNTNDAEVSLIKGNDRRDNTFKALKNIEDNIMASLEGKKRILVKPNFVSTSTPLSATHVDAVRGILDFLKPRWNGEIVVGESTASHNGTMTGFRNYNYLPLEKEYGVTLLDLNEESWVKRYFLGPGNKPVSSRLISTFLDKDQYIISAAKMKTHDRVLVTLALKNVLLAAPLHEYHKHNDKHNLHLTKTRSKSTPLHYNMFSLAQEIYPDLGVIDGFVAMEGNGPTGGTPVDARVALASTDSLALDTITTKIMGFNPKEVLYLSSMNQAGMGQGDLDKIQTLGTDLNKVQYHFRPHERMVEPYGLG